MAVKYKVILSTGSFTVPADWNSANNKIHGIGAGQGGGIGLITSGSDPAGAGGAYTYAANVTLTPGGTAEAQVGVAGVQGSVAPTDSWVKSTVGGTTVMLAKSATSAIPSVGGAAASCTPSANAFSGGNAGGVVGTRSGPGGGGAAGPNGAGKAGANGLGGTAAGGGGGGAANNGSVGSVPTNQNGANGGNNRSSTGGGAGSGSGVGAAGTNGGGGGGGFVDVGATTGYAGGAGSQDGIWTDTDSSLTYGPGSGGAGGGGNNGTGTAGNGGNAGGYGAGGGSGGSFTGGGTQGARGTATGGLIVLEWEVGTSGVPALLGKQMSGGFFELSGGTN